MPRKTTNRVIHHPKYAPYNTPQKNRLYGAFEALEDIEGVPIKSDIFAKFGFSKRSGWRHLKAWRDAKEKEAAGEPIDRELRTGEAAQAEAVQDGKKESAIDDVGRRVKHSTLRTEKRGRKRIISEEQIKLMKEILEKRDAEGERLSWKALGREAGVQAAPDTIAKAMGTRKMDTRKSQRPRKTEKSAGAG
ncbi:hypothetical protein EDC01DRAFT_629679 [Geopyxis carbonaria]|nr:hypothetical protein EDC01DRAFT_629679 [Geopyxis carbonaria]